jgi:hypothetical protein
MTQADDRTPVMMRGYVGWGNRKAGVEAYGPGGRWNGEGEHADYGDLLGEALERAGCHEGSPFLVVAIPSRFGKDDLDGFEEAIQAVIRTREMLAESEQALGR